MKIYEAIENVRREVGVIQKTGHNPHFKNDYMTLTGIHSELDKLLDSHDLIVSQFVDGLRLVTAVYIKGFEDEKLVTEIPLVGANNMQQLGSAITYARRYSIVAIFGILDKDDDGNEASGKEPKKDKGLIPATKDVLLIAKQKELIALIGDDIKKAEDLKKELNITANVNSMSIPQLNDMIAKAKEK